jgi:hypothetical protein
MHTLKIASVLAAGLLSAAAASAASVTLDFNGVSNYGSVADFYNGGTDYLGASGTNYGVSFTGSVLALANDGLGGGSAGQYFTGSPTTTVVFANQGDVPAVMNVASGFSGTLGLTYASVSAPTTVSIWSGLNDTGTLLSSFTLTANSDGCDAGSPVCVWTAGAQTFAGIAKSVDFSSNAGNALFTNIAITPVPLPASGLLMMFGVAGLSIFGTRRRAASAK